MTDDELQRLRDEVARLEAALDTERANADQWREVAESRRVALEKVRQHPVVKVLFWIAGWLLPPVRRARKRATKLEREARKVASGVAQLPAKIDAPRREQALRRAIAALPPAPASDRRVSIVVLTRDGADNLARLLPALRARTAMDRVELLVVDNASGPATRRFLAALSESEVGSAAARPDVRVLRNDTNRSFSEANNQAAAEATGDVLLFLNDDVEPLSDGWLDRMLAALAPDDVVAVGAQLVYPRRPLLGSRTRDLGVQHLGTELVPVAGGFPQARNVGEGRDPDPSLPVHEVAAATAACLAVERDAFEAAGGFDERYVYGAEDVDLCWSLRRAGGRVVVAPDAVLFHHEGETRHRVDEVEARNRRQAANWDALAARFGPELRRAVERERLTGSLVLTSVPYHLAITVTRDLESAGYGDWYTAHELGEACAALGWRVSYVERYRDAWYDLPDDVDALLVLLDTFDLRKLDRPGLTTIAWVRNWTERWTSHPWFDDFDLVLASSRTSADLIAGESRHTPTVLPLATNPSRFSAGEDDGAGRPRAGAVFTGNYWGKDARLPELVAAVPDLTVYGKGWEDVPAVAGAWQGQLPYDELPAVYRSALVVVDQAADHTRPYGSVNSRVFDALSAGALPVTNQVAGARELFGDDLPTWETAPELAALVADLTADPGRTARLAGELRDRVLAEHTYAARAASLRDLLLARADRPSFALATSVPERRAAQRWGDWHFAEGLGRELRALGHPVRLLIQDEWTSRDARTADVFVHLKGRSVAPPADGQLHVIWNISHPEELTPEECDAADLVLVASHTGMAEQLRGRTSTPVGVLLQATDERRFRPRPRDPRFAHDLVFVGNSRFVMRQAVRDALDAGLDLAIYGANWEKFVDPSLVRSTHVPNDELAAVYSSATLVLNDHWEGMRRHGFASNRLFDALAAGAVVVSDDVPGLDGLFDGAVATFTGADELRDVVQRLLADEDDRQARSERGRSAVLAAHTFAHRARELVDHVEAARAARRGTR
ncbi:MAG: glycosyltransferase [Actinobacteria bacterium]|nr:glycosyltransferase [Actinomycetota bacterium]